MAQLSAALVYAIGRVRVATPPPAEGTWDGWVTTAAVLGTRDTYAQWRHQQLEKRTAEAARLALSAAGRSTDPRLDALRSVESQCRYCGGQTFLVEERTRRSDEPSDWFRLCPSCKTIVRPER